MKIAAADGIHAPDQSPFDVARRFRQDQICNRLSPCRKPLRPPARPCTSPPLKPSSEPVYENQARRLARKAPSARRPPLADSAGDPASIHPDSASKIYYRRRPVAMLSTIPELETRWVAGIAIRSTRH